MVDDIILKSGKKIRRHHKWKTKYRTKGENNGVVWEKEER